ncbi:GIY-YIG nuclease family protein [Endozoicomonas sp. GU-1]|uniref:GIY-YIG nuclease family protein n=1 Tax=Endozoicomonas sp. GU-1 TaxID=3009078 RepID=UPI0022B3610F|nr:GIY-YIG nuclease family protein [Endozoicomonas sp. GU-1]WBA81356.1 GIY-YIG nuclease family protein [Endozoicomonas sp. GU-1]WBA84304.1 GIY-YIG nuclease family protein [Endozoicomonas sp. GU-1]
MIDYGITACAFETEELRRQLSAFFDSSFLGQKVGNYKFGVYAFYDYEREPIYIGQTKESLRTRIRRHLTNRRTDAVAMSVLDPMEVYEIEVWPLPQYTTLSKDERKTASLHLDAL